MLCIRHRAWRAGVPIAMRGSGFEGPGGLEAPGGPGGPEGPESLGMWGPSPTEMEYIGEPPPNPSKSSRLTLEITRAHAQVGGKTTRKIHYAGFEKSRARMRR